MIEGLGSMRWRNALGNLSLFCLLCISVGNDHHPPLAKALLSERVQFYQITVYVLKDMILLVSQL